MVLAGGVCGEAAVRAYTTARFVSRQTTHERVRGYSRARAAACGRGNVVAVIIGDTRISALSPTLLRIEAKGPQGFENRQTFNVIGRDEFGE